jgi:hypothetical protein
MPLTDFTTLPDDARIWIFGADAPLDDVDAERLLTVVDRFLTDWAAHGHPLTSARDWRDERFLVVGVDQRTEGASGCSIDGLFRALTEIEKGIGASLVGGGNLFFRDDATGFVHAVSRGDFTLMAKMGDVTGTTRVFDTTLTTLGDYRRGFERAASASWHAALLT